MDIFPQLIMNGIIAGAIYALVALGFNLIYGVTRFFNVAHGALCAVGGYIVYFFTKSIGLNIYVAMFLGTLGAGLIGYLSDRLVYAPLRRRKASQTVFLVASLGLFTALQAMIAMLFTSQFQTIGIRETGAQPIYHVLGGIITETQSIILFSGLVIMLMLTWLMKRIVFGQHLRAVSDDPEIASVVGINVERVISIVFFIGSAIAGYAGIMVGFDTGIEPTMGMSLLLKGVIASIVGGVGSVYGGVFGAFLLGIVENLGIWKLSGEWKDAIAFLLLILFLVFRPKGLIKK